MEEMTRRTAEVQLQGVVFEESDTDVLPAAEGEEPDVTDRIDDDRYDSLEGRMGTLAVDLITSTEVLDRQVCMTAEGLAMSERRERQETSTQIYAGYGTRGITIQDSNNVNLSLGSQNNGTMERCILNLKIRKTKEVFAETDNIVMVESILKRERHVTLSGASGEGKTSLSLMLGYKYTKYGYDLIFVNDVDKFRLDDHIAPGKKVFFIFDDIFGTVGLSTDVPQLRRILHDLQLWIEEGKKESDRVQKEGEIRHARPETCVVFTTKTYNLECGSSKLDGQEFFFFKGPSVIDLTRMKSYKYSFTDRTKIFQKHKDKHDLTVELEDIYDTDQEMFGFPLICKLFFEFNAFHKNPKDFFKKPLFYLRRELEKLLQYMNEQSAALVLMLLCDDQMDLKNVETEYESTPEAILFRSVKSLIPNITGVATARAARDFRGTFFTVGDKIGFSHPTIYDACACALYKIAPTFVLKKCTIKFLYERLSDMPTPTTSVSDHLHIIYVSEVYYDIIAERLAQAVEEGNYSMSITHPVLKRQEIVDKVFALLQLRKTTIFDRLVDTNKKKKTRILHSQEDGKHLLYWAVQSHSLYLVQKVLAIGYKFSDTEITDAFKACAACGNIAVMEFLLSKYGFTETTVLQALSTATENNYSKIVTKLLGNCTNCTNILCKHPKLLLTAKANANHEIQRALLRYICKDKNLSFLSEDNCNMANRLLHFACVNGDIQLATFVVSVSYLNYKDNANGSTPIMAAAQNGHKHVMNLLVSKGVDTTLTDNDSNNVLHHACEGGNIYIVEQLLPLFDINIKGWNGLTPIMIAAVFGKKDVFDLLVSKGADLTLTDNDSYNVLHRACKGGNTYIVEQLIPLCDINIRGWKGLTPIMIAAVFGKKDVFDLLVSKEADLTLTDNDSYNVLHHACEGGNTYIVEQLLPLCDINIRGNGLTPIMIAAVCGKKDVFDLLVSKGADLTLTDNYTNTVLHRACEGSNTYIVAQLLPLFDINITGQDSMTLVMTAAKYRKNDVFYLLMSNGANLTLTDINGDNILHYASRSGSADIVKQVLHRFDINIRDRCGWSPLMTAAMHGHETIFEFLLSMRAKHILKNCNENIFHLACQSGNMNIIRFLLPKFHANCRNPTGMTPAMTAALCGKWEVFDFVVSKEADLTLTDDNNDNVLHHASAAGNTYIVESLLPLFDINIRGRNDLTPIMYAAVFEKKDVFEVLLSKGADLKLTNSYDQSVLHCAVHGGNSYIVEQLLSLFDINIRGKHGMTPIMDAAVFGRRKIFELLLSKEPDLTIVDNNGDTTLHHARQGGNVHIVERLLQSTSEGQLA